MILLSTVTVVFMTGCQDSNIHPIAVVNFDKVATSTGQLKIFEEEIRIFTEDTQSQLNKIKNELNIQLETAKESLGQKPTQKDLAEFQKISNAAQIKLRQELVQGERLLQQKRAQLVQDYKQRIEPAIRRVAQQKKIQVVMIKQENLLYIDSSSDITNAVIDAIQSLPSATNTPSSE